MNRLLVVLCAAACAAPVLAQSVIPLQPRGTFLRANQDTVTSPVIRTLASLGIAPGDLIRIRMLGEYEQNAQHTISRSGIAVFSSSSTVLASNITQRVPDAIDAGIDFVTPATFMGGVATDIPQDFRTTEAEVMVVVPQGAVFLFLGVYDSYYQDNTDADGDFAAEVTLVCAGNICCGSADFDGDGDFGTDFDIQAFFACLGGTCCPTCGSSDFNGDGDFGTDLDIQSFFAVLGGNGCVY